jgi:predicted nucleic acid-binding Zn ribbon protein
VIWRVACEDCGDAIEVATRERAQRFAAGHVTSSHTDCTDTTVERTDAKHIVCQACEHVCEAAPTTCPECGAWMNEERLNEVRADE